MKGINNRGLYLAGTALVAMLTMNACMHDGETTDDPFANVQATYTSLWDAYFSSCATNCHEAGGTESDGPDMSTKAAFYSGLFGKSSSDYAAWTRTGDCDGYAYIATGDAAGSLLPATIIESSSNAFSAANGDCTTGFNVHVVNQIQVESDNLKQQIIAWIDNGAENN